jgi:hypothetical protein
MELLSIGKRLDRFYSGDANKKLSELRHTIEKTKASREELEALVRF